MLANGQSKCNCHARFSARFLNTTYCTSRMCSYYTSPNSLFSVIGEDFRVGIGLSLSLTILALIPTFVANLISKRKLSVVETCCHLSENFSRKFLRPWKLKLVMTAWFTGDHAPLLPGGSNSHFHDFQ